MAELIITLDRKIIKRIDLDNHAYTLGRDFGCDIIINDRTVSSEHARIVQSEDDCFLEDLGSTNGTYVNAFSIQKHLLEDGDIVQLGKHYLYYRAEGDIRTQINRLCLNPNLLDHPLSAWLEMMDGRKAGQVISLEKSPTVLGNPYGEHIHIRKNARGIYIMENRDYKDKALSHPLTMGSVFLFEGITFKFHQIQ